MGTLVLPARVVESLHAAARTKSGAQYTGRQLVRAATDFMHELQADLGDADAERPRGGGPRGRREASDREPVRERLTMQASWRRMDATENAAVAAAHAVLRGPAQYAATFRALSVALRLDQGGDPPAHAATPRLSDLRILDVGAGCGASTLAAREALAAALAAGADPHTPADRFLFGL